MKYSLYQVDTFTDKIFSGNPAAVCPLEKWLPESVMQNIAMENNLAETAFIVREPAHYSIRWFTPLMEVDLCGHATLASAFVLYHYLHAKEDTILFHSPRSGALSVSRDGLALKMNLPADSIEEVELSEPMLSSFSIRPLRAYKGKSDFMLLFDNEEEIRTLEPRLNQIASLPARGVIVTAKGNECDFVSRFFAPQSGIDEDPVTGSAHTTLAPYWAEELHKTELSAIQLSKRKGELFCALRNDRVEISGRCVPYLSGEIEI